VENELAARFEALDDAYLRERAADIRDICRRIMANLKGISLNVFEDIKEDVLIIAKDLAPSDTSFMDFGLVKGFVTALGGSTSHTCIIARNVGIPAAVGQEGILDEITDGEYVILDGEECILITSPDDATVQDYRRKISEKEAKKEALKALAGLPTVTSDGRHLELFANVGGIQDIKAAVENGAEGIGLFRTEFLYMEGRAFPTEEEQFAVYKEAAEICGDKPVIIRTLDIGGDKSLPFFTFPAEENPFLGWRAIRMCLEMKDMFKTQLRALLRASAYGNIRIMLPMIISIEEYNEAVGMLEECKKELTTEGISFKPDIQTGIMIETPASVLIAEDLAREVDFFSIGTNDLTQYILAVDRGNNKISALYNSFHPAVLRAIKSVVDAGAKYGKMVGMCGEFASNEKATKLLLGMGLIEFSVSPPAVPELKGVLRELNYENASAYSAIVLSQSTVASVMSKL